MIAQSNIERSDRPGVDMTDGQVDPAAIAEALDDVISDIDRFLSLWFKRLSHNADSFQAAAKPDERLRRRMQDFEQEKLRWKAKRHSEQRRIQEKAEQLTEAWLRLEAEQRRFLQIKDAHPGSGGSRAVAIDTTSRDPAVGPDTKTVTALVENERTASSQNCVAESQTTTHRSPVRTGRSREVAVQQFQQLRREIESSRPGCGKP